MVTTLREFLDDFESRHRIPDYIKIAAEHDYNCLCNNCFLYWADIGTQEDHGRFEIEVLNLFRAKFGRPPLPSENDILDDL